MTIRTNCYYRGSLYEIEAHITPRGRLGGPFAGEADTIIVKGANLPKFSRVSQQLEDRVVKAVKQELPPLTDSASYWPELSQMVWSER